MSLNTGELVSWHAGWARVPTTSVTYSASSRHLSCVSPSNVLDARLEVFCIVVKRKAHAIRNKFWMLGLSLLGFKFKNFLKSRPRNSSNGNPFSLNGCATHISQAAFVLGSVRPTWVSKIDCICYPVSVSLLIYDSCFNSLFNLIIYKVGMWAFPSWYRYKCKICTVIYITDAFAN